MQHYTPNIPRTQMTICGAPKAIAIPRIAPITIPRHAVCHRHGAEHHHKMNGRWRQPREEVRLQRVAARLNGELWACASSGAQARSAPAAALALRAVTNV